MAPKGHRSVNSAQLRSHSRTNSAAKITTNLQFTQKDLPPSKHTDKQKKNGYGQDVPLPFVRPNSSQRILSKEHLQPVLLKRGYPVQKTNGVKTSAFTIANSKDEEDEDWVSSESGAVTPNHPDSDSDTTSEADGSQNIIYTQQSAPTIHSELNGKPPVPLQRVETIKQSDFDPIVAKAENSVHDRFPRTTLSSPPLLPAETQRSETILHSQLRRLELDTTKETRTDVFPQAQYSPRLSNTKRSSRPSSTYSATGKFDIRPHPLIRGQSYGHVNPCKPLIPFTVIPGPAPPQLSTSPPNSIHDDPRNYLSTSPASSIAKSIHDRPSTSQDRRTSISSARSVVTLPTQSIFRDNPRAQDRTRTLSTVSASSSSAALSALAHLPAITRPPSPQAVSFFPPINPHLNVEAIHPLLPGPYLNNHLTVLARRTPIRESFDRVIRAKQAL